MPSTSGVVFPVSSTAAMAEGGEPRSSMTFGRGVVSDALEVIDPVSAASAVHETSWRREYPRYFRRLVELTVDDPTVAVQIARAGLDSVHSRMCWRSPDAPGDQDQDLTTAFDATGTPLQSQTVEGSGDRETEFTLPIGGRRLRGPEVTAQLGDWVVKGIIEPGVAQAIHQLQQHPEWLDVRDQRFVVLGASAEMGPLRALLRWGATVAAVDLPRAALWDQTMQWARDGAGTVVAPVSEGQVGADLLHDVGRVAAWLADQPGPLVLGNYVYADGGLNLRLSAATDALAVQLGAQRADLALAYLATPTDVFAVPPQVVAQSQERYGHAYLSKVRGPLRALSGGRLLTRQYAPGEVAGISDSIVPQQGPNYLLAKRIHRWRATAAAADGRLVSMNIAPPTRTRSVTKNRALAAAYAGAHRFGIEVFEPATSNTLMAGLLVHDLRTGGAAKLGPGWHAEAAQAAHGGLWRTAYAPRSALGIAALLGYGASRG